MNTKLQLGIAPPESLLNGLCCYIASLHTYKAELEQALKIVVEHGMADTSTGCTEEQLRMTEVEIKVCLSFQELLT